MLARASQKFTVGQYQKINFYDDIMIPLSDELTELTKQKFQSIEWNIPDTKLSFNGDVTLIRLLLRNLVENSHRYSPKQTKIVVSCYKDKKDIFISVEDEGQALTNQKAKNSLKPFSGWIANMTALGLV